MGDWLFFVASKLFWLLARPETILLMMIFAGAMMRRRWLGVTAVAVMLAIGALPVTNWLIYPLERQFPPNPDIAAAQGVIVLGGASQAGVAMQWDTLALNEHGERFLGALSLAAKRPDLQIVFSGGSGSLNSAHPPEAAAAVRILLSTGIEPARLRIEGASRNTTENAYFTRELLGDEADAPWILMTSAWHMPRAAETFCAAGWSQIIPYPVDYLSQPGRPWPDWRFAERLNHTNLAIKEWIGHLAYRMTGRASDRSCVLEAAGG